MGEVEAYRHVGKTVSRRNGAVDAFVGTGLHLAGSIYRCSQHVYAMS